MSSQSLTVLQAELVDDQDFVWDLSGLCAELHCAHTEALDLIQVGVLHPTGNGPSHWRFCRLDLYRAQLSRRLARDLELDLSGAALAVELLERLQSMAQP